MTYELHQLVYKQELVYIPEDYNNIMLIIRDKIKKETRDKPGFITDSLKLKIYLPLLLFVEVAGFLPVLPDASFEEELLAGLSTEAGEDFEAEGLLTALESDLLALGVTALLADPEREFPVVLTCLSDRWLLRDPTSGFEVRGATALRPGCSFASRPTAGRLEFWLRGVPTSGFEVRGATVLRPGCSLVSRLTSRRFSF